MSDHIDTFYPNVTGIRPGLRSKNMFYGNDHGYYSPIVPIIYPGELLRYMSGMIYKSLQQLKGTCLRISKRSQWIIKGQITIGVTYTAYQEQNTGNIAIVFGHPGRFCQRPFG